jgi:hypothetical protein
MTIPFLVYCTIVLCGDTPPPFPELAALKLDILGIYCILRESENQETDSS